MTGTRITCWLPEGHIWIKQAITDMQRDGESQGVPMSVSDIIRDALTIYFKDYHASHVTDKEGRRMVDPSSEGNSEAEKNDGHTV